MTITNFIVSASIRLCVEAAIKAWHIEERYLADTVAAHLMCIEGERYLAAEEIRGEEGLSAPLIIGLIVKSQIASLARVHLDALACTWRPITLLSAAVMGSTSHLGDLLTSVDGVAEVGVVLPLVLKITPRMIFGGQS